MERDADLPARADPVDALILDLLEWLDRAPRPYADVMEAWRTSCPRLPVWEEANARGYIEQRRYDGTTLVSLTAAGSGWLARRRTGIASRAP